MGWLGEASSRDETRFGGTLQKNDVLSPWADFLVLFVLTALVALSLLIVL